MTGELFAPCDSETMNEFTSERVLPQCQPFLKWAGGKRWLSTALGLLIGNDATRYLEPFLGSGAAFFASSVSDAILSDCNSELINCFTMVRDRPSNLISRLSQLDISRETFSDMRPLLPKSAIDRAVRFIYLNKTAFNGLYRVNRNGGFNVPFGCKPTTELCDQSLIEQCSQRLQPAKLSVGDFSCTLKNAKAGDHVYLDPPYTVKHNNNGFRRYNERLFSWTDQERLAVMASERVRSGVCVVVTNGLHQDVRRLYSSRDFLGFTVTRASNMAAQIEKRGLSSELLLVSITLGHSQYRLLKLLRECLPYEVRSIRLLGR
jgi:DNA adenine methylase